MVYFIHIIIHHYFPDGKTWESNGVLFIIIIFSLELTLMATLVFVLIIKFIWRVDCYVNSIFHCRYW